MAKRIERRYSDEFRAQAVATVRAEGWPDQVGVVPRVSEQLGIPKRSLYRWLRGDSNPPPANLVTEKEEELSELFEREIRAAFEAAGVKREEAKYRDLMIGIGIATEKLQLLRGEPTERLSFALTPDDIVRSQQRIDEWKQQRQLTRKPNLNGSS